MDRSNHWTFPAAILVLSLLPRLPNLGAPPLERHDFRQTQTSITVQAYLDRGLSLLDYETPVFGPPWKVPFEFPTFQVSAYAMARTGVPLDLACRITALIWFYASAILLFLVSRRFAGGTIATVALAFYVLSPFAIQWSRACLIEYAAVTLSLGYLLCVASWAERPRAAPAVGALTIGALAFATKITTLAVVFPALVIVTLAAIRRVWGAGTGSRIRVVAHLAVLAAVPLAAGLAWTKWADAVKAAAPATEWITSERLTGWNFGTLAQRLTAKSWADILARFKWIVPGFFLGALAFAAAAVWRRRDPLRLVIAAALAGALLPIATFFNLYLVHDYYLIAVTPCLSVAAAAGVMEFLSLRIPRRELVLGAVTVATVVSLKSPFKYARSAYEDTRKRPVVALARVVQEVTPPDRWVVIEGDDWSPRIPYLSHRRSFMIRPPFVAPALIASRPEVATLVCFTCPQEVLAYWPNLTRVAREGGAEVYSVGHGGGAPSEGVEGRPACLDSTRHAP